MDQWNTQYRPAPQFEQEQLGAVPAPAQQERPDLEAMAIKLDQLKVEAAIDAERTRPSLNGLLAFFLVGGATFIGEYVGQYGAQSIEKLTLGKAAIDLQMVGQALGAGVVVAAVVAVMGYLATRRTYKRVRTFEQQLISLGGTPLPERGLPLIRGTNSQD
jgi:hypothetical protein